MGTSKGYITPTNIHWTNTKREITQYLNNNSDDGIPKIVRKFTKAMREEHISGSSFTRATFAFLGLYKNIQDYGIEYALTQINRNDLIDKTSEEIWSKLFEEFTNNGATIEDSLAADALSKALSNLNIIEPEEIINIKQDILLKEILACFIIINFEFRYAEKIDKKKSPAQARKILDEIGDYITSIIHEKLDLKAIEGIDFNNIDNCSYVDKIINDTYTLVENIYMEV